MCVKPVDAPRSCRNADVLWDRDGLAVIQDHEMLMDVDPLSLLRIARDTIDRLAHRLAHRASRGRGEGTNEKDCQPYSGHERM
jgi:hypothetical protein